MKPGNLMLMILVSILACPLLFAQSNGQSPLLVQVEIETLYPDSSANRMFFQQLLEDAAYGYSQLYSQHLQLFFSRESERNTDLTLLITALNSDGTEYMSLSLDDGQQRSQPFMILKPWDEIPADYVSKVLFYLQAALNDFSPDAQASEPELIDIFTLEYLRFRDMPQQPYLNPTSAAFDAQDNLVLGAQSLALIFDSHFNLINILGKEDVASGRSGDFFDVVTTVSGSLYARPLQGSAVKRYVPGNTEAQRLPSTVSAPLDFTVLSDGTLIYADSSQPRIISYSQGQTSTLNVLQNAYISPSAMAGGPSGELWFYNPSSAQVEIYTPEGVLLRSILPLLPKDQQFSPRHLVPASDGSFLLMTISALYRFAATGELRWKLESPAWLPGASFNTALGLAFNEHTGEIVIPMSSSASVIRLLDRDYQQRNALAPHPQEALIPLAKRTAGQQQNIESQLSMAEQYEEVAAIELASYHYQQVIQAAPNNSFAHQRLEELEIASAKEQADIISFQVEQVLSSYGPESARPLYRQAITLFEEILHLRPSDREALSAKAELEQRFAQAENQRGGVRQMEIREVRLPDVFPSLMQHYAANGWGSFTIKNPLAQTAHIIDAEVYVPGYMDLATTQSIDMDVNPGASVSVTLQPVFQQSLLDIQEDLPAQARISIRYSTDGSGIYRQDQTHSIQIHRKTALSWDDSAKLASFIVPNEQTIETFAINAASRAIDAEEIHIGQRTFRAMAIVQALASRGFHYREDPVSPSSQVIGNETAVDTVRFPRTSLYYQSGDCDDSTALLNSLFEAASIPSAIVTTPGHVFSAFDSGEPQENAWLFRRNGLEVIPADGSLWIPVETTVFELGFMEAWRQGSAQYTRYKSDSSFEFIPTAKAWEQYPPMPLPNADLHIVPPAPQKLSETISDSSDRLVSVLYTQALSELEHQFARSQNRASGRILSRIGALHATFGHYDRAERELRRAIAMDDANLYAYVYLCNVLIQTGEYQQAIQISQDGLAARPDSATLLVGRSIAYHYLGNQRALEQSLDRLADISPDMAERYKYLAGNDVGMNRASDADQAPMLIWPSEDDGEL